MALTQEFFKILEKTFLYLLFAITAHMYASFETDGNIFLEMMAKKQMDISGFLGKKSVFPIFDPFPVEIQKIHLTPFL